LANNSKEARDRAEASFKKQEQRAREGAKAMADYEAEGRAMREKTARLKSLRMAKQAAGKEVVAESEPASARSPRSPMKSLP
jgi:vacuolar-type H+-ATPase subunit E/Vma4